MSENIQKKDKNNKKPWYKRWWGIAAIVIGALVILGLIVNALTPAEAVPNVVGKTAAQAEETLRDAGFTNIKIKSEDGKIVIAKNNWDVVSQSPKAGEKAKPATEIELTVSHERIEKEQQKEEKAKQDEKKAERAKKQDAEKAENQKLEEERKATTNSTGLDSIAANQACGKAWENALRIKYPSSKVKIHSIAGVLRSEKVGENFEVKLEGSVNGGTINVECTVSGNRDNPQVDMVAVY
ncbi:PASTA domain-containing protein [Varibaculum massiliense]|uniref:PASTA domain-containing protein n=1 Tax=Varibaculum massiliense TaxID=1852372 RepID=UPI0008DAFAE4|nr:PASTA domain-containing protein [Varibaculum massiliense]